MGHGELFPWVLFKSWGLNALLYFIKLVETEKMTIPFQHNWVAAVVVPTLECGFFSRVCNSVNKFKKYLQRGRSFSRPCVIVMGKGQVQGLFFVCWLRASIEFQSLAFCLVSDPDIISKQPRSGDEQPQAEMFKVLFCSDLTLRVVIWI